MTVKRLRYPKRSKPQSVQPPVRGGWWWACSTLSPERIEQRFQNEDVGGILIETIHKVVSTDRYLFDVPVILVQIQMPAHRQDQKNMELCLMELGIGLLDPIEEDLFDDDD